MHVDKEIKIMIMSTHGKIVGKDKDKENVNPWKDNGLEEKELQDCTLIKR